MRRDGFELPLRADPAAPGANLGRQLRRRRPDGGVEAIEEALAVFNATEAARTVAGLTRTLGEPRVSIGAVAGSPGELRVTVAWDLTWYQWAVDPAGGEPLLLANGEEVEQLDGSARQWNGKAVAGRIELDLGRERVG